MFLARMAEHFRGVMGSGWTSFWLRVLWGQEMEHGATCERFMEACRCVGAALGC